MAQEVSQAKEVLVGSPLSSCSTRPKAGQSQDVRIQLLGKEKGVRRCQKRSGE